MSEHTTKYIVTFPIVPTDDDYHEFIVGLFNALVRVNLELILDAEEVVEGAPPQEIVPHLATAIRRTARNFPPRPRRRFEDAADKLAESMLVGVKGGSA